MIRIATTGPESSGKTSLSLWLQEQITQSRHIPEYARAYLSESNGVYSASDLIHFAEQLERELRTRETTDVVVADTDFYVLEIWFSEKFPDTINPIGEYVERNSFDLYLLCAPDLAWEPDPLRENPNDRDRLFERYEQVLIRDGRQYAIITGNGELRTRTAAAAIRRVFPGLLPPDRG